MSEGAAQAFIFFLAGFETSSTTAAFCLYELAINQDMQEKVRQEIFSKLGENDELSYESLHEMTYLHKVILGKVILLFLLFLIILYKCTI